MTDRTGGPITTRVEQAEAILRASPDHRVLKRIPSTEIWAPTSTRNDGDVRRAAFVDVETTGLDLEGDEVIELAILPFDYDLQTGTVLGALPEMGLFALREPSIPIPDEASAVHGIGMDDVRGATIDEAEIGAVLASIELLIAHNAAFDRPMVEKHWPIFEEKAWACSLSEVDWRHAGMSAGKLDYLLMRFGWFFEGHRARHDAEAGAFLLTQKLPDTERSVLSALLENARTKKFLIRATGAPYEARGLLKRSGYRWDPGDDTTEKAWWLITATPESETEWLRKNVFRRNVAIPIVPVSARTRHSLRQFRPPPH
ncbi:MAG: 3'-5' exonuclease [Hyphomonadaceae bacterium]